MRTTFSRRLRELREEAGLSQKKLSENTNVSAASIGYYENGDREPGLDIAMEFAKFFGVSLDYMAGLEDYRTHEAADISARTGLTEAAVSVLTLLPVSDFMLTTVAEMVSGLIEKSIENPGDEWEDEEDNDLTDDERNELKQVYLKEKSAYLKCRHGADVLGALFRYYYVCAHYVDEFFGIAVHDGNVIHGKNGKETIGILRDIDSPLLFNSKAILENVFLDALIDTIKLGAKEFTEEHPELHPKEAPDAEE